MIAMARWKAWRSTPPSLATAVTCPPVKEFALQTGDKVRMLCLDACLLVCGSMNKFSCEENMRPNQLSIQAKHAQLEWLERELTVNSRWKFVVSHWGGLLYYRE
eukprot:TRINITY_DN11774_c0_g4_i5.p4 TRINITY_DN11774_c0_g4~~TRINITY_DN11774_c0_g4_i5.p4  ORF type:complete len:104 (+),score=18.35 TRINITY_DN11774_c0_g4_i5:346-657(+)